MSDEGSGLNLSNEEERRILIKVIWINISQVALAGVVGIIINSSGLLGTALDSSGDTAIYLLSLYACAKQSLETYTK